MLKVNRIADPSNTDRITDPSQNITEVPTEVRQHFQGGYYKEFPCFLDNKTYN